MSSIERLPEEIKRLIAFEIKDKPAIKNARLAIPAFSIALTSALFQELDVCTEPEARLRVATLAGHETLGYLVKKLVLRLETPFRSGDTYSTFLQHIHSMKASFPNLTSIVIRFAECDLSHFNAQMIAFGVVVDDPYDLEHDAVELINNFTAFRHRESSVQDITEMTCIDVASVDLANGDSLLLTCLARLRKLHVSYSMHFTRRPLFLSRFLQVHVQKQKFDNLTVLSLHQEYFNTAMEYHLTPSGSRFPVLKHLSFCRMAWYRCEQLEWIFSLSKLESICFVSCSIALCFSGQTPRCQDVVDDLRSLQAGTWIAVKNSGPPGTQSQERSHCWWSDLRWNSVLCRLQGMPTLMRVIWDSTLVERYPRRFLKKRGTWSGDFSARYVLLKGLSMEEERTWLSNATRSRSISMEEGRTWHSNATGSRSIWCDSKMLTMLPSDSLLNVNSDAGDGKASAILATARLQAERVLYTGIKGFWDGDLRRPHTDFQVHGLDPNAPAVVSVKDTAPRQLMRWFRQRFNLDRIQSGRIYFTSKQLEPYLVNRARAIREFEDLGGESAYQRQFCFGISEMEDQDDRKAWQDLQDELQSRRSNQWLLN